MESIHPSNHSKRKRKNKEKEKKRKGKGKSLERKSRQKGKGAPMQMNVCVLKCRKLKVKGRNLKPIPKQIGGPDFFISYYCVFFLIKDMNEYELLKVKGRN